MPKYELFTTAEAGSYAELRSYTGRSSSVTISGGSAPGVFYYDDTDLSTADDGLNTIVDYKGRRWKRLGLTSLTFTQVGTGAVARTAQAKMRDILSVKDFGATGDGVADDTTYIQAAIDAANALGGATVYFPAGVYKTTATLNMAKWVVLQGSGKLASEISYTGTAHAVKMSARVNSSTAVHTAVRDMGIICTSSSNTGACYADVGGTFVEVTNCALTGGKFGVLFDQTELATIRLNDIEAQTVNGAGIWLVNGPDHTPGVTFTAALSAGATSGTLTGNWTGLTGTYNLEFTETVGGAREFRTATLTNGSTAVTWTTGLAAACNAGTTAATSQFTNRILITENQINNGGQGAVSHIIDDGGVAHEICFNNFNSGRVLATPPVCRFAGVLRLTFFSNYMEGGQTMLAFESTAFYSGSGAGLSAAVTIQSNIISMSQPNTPITMAAGANPMALVCNWFGGGSAYKVTGASINTSISAFGNVYTSGDLLDSQSTYLAQFDNNGNRVNQLLSIDSGIGYGTGAGGTVTQAAGSKANGVTLNKITGEIVLSNANIAAGATINIPFTNSKIGANDLVLVQRKSGGTDSSYKVGCDRTFAGGCQIWFKNDTGGALAEAVTLQFAVVPSVVA